MIRRQEVRNKATRARILLYTAGERETGKILEQLQKKIFCIFCYEM